MLSVSGILIIERRKEQQEVNEKILILSSAKKCRVLLKNNFCWTVKPQRRFKISNILQSAQIDLQTHVLRLEIDFIPVYCEGYYGIGIGGKNHEDKRNQTGVFDRRKSIVPGGGSDRKSVV